MSQWEVDLHARVAKAIKQHRAGRSAQDLSDRTAELGYPVSRAQIANYESGRKKNLDIAELLIIAAALDVPPMVLLYPGMPSERVEIVPGELGTSWDAYLWATGTATSLWNTATPSAGAQLVQAVRERHELLFEIARLRVRLGLNAHSDDAEIRAALEKRATSIDLEIARLNAVIRDSGGILNDD